jgi:hypothetical protein
MVAWGSFSLVIEIAKLAEIKRTYKNNINIDARDYREKIIISCNKNLFLCLYFSVVL